MFQTKDDMFQRKFDTKELQILTGHMNCQNILDTYCRQALKNKWIIQTEKYDMYFQWKS